MLDNILPLLERLSDKTKGLSALQRSSLARFEGKIIMNTKIHWI